MITDIGRHPLYAWAMRVVINGEERTVAEAISIAGLVAELVEERGLPRAAYAVELNRVVIPRREHAERFLADGDVLEIVTLVGGG